MSINHRNFPVVPVVEVDAVHIAVNRIEYLHLNSRVLHSLERCVRKTGQIAKVIKNYVDLYAGSGPLSQHRKHPVPKLPLCQDIVLQENIDLCLGEMFNQIIKKGLAIAKILGLRVSIE